MAREPVITGEASGLKCDAPGCGWSDMSIKRSEYEGYRNAPCPRCGSNILTDADWKLLLRLEAIIRFFNKWLWWLPKGKGARLHRVEFGGDGTGKLYTEDKGPI